MAGETVKVTSIYTVVSMECCSFELGRLESMADWDRSSVPQVALVPPIFSWEKYYY
jgi:hypothetical protein